MSKFDKIFAARDAALDEKSQEAENPESFLPTRKPKKEIKTGKPSLKALKTAPSHVSAPVIPQSEDINRQKRGRPPAKRSDPDFIGFTTYVRKETHRKVKIELLLEGTGRELSELVEELLSNWVKNK